MRLRFCILIPLLAAFLSLNSAWSAPKPRHTSVATGNKRLSHRIDALLAEPVAAQAHWGISVTTLDGRVLYEKNEGQLFAPASNAKLLTTTTALALLGPRTTIVTRVIAAGPDPHGVVHGDLTLVGAGDPSMSGRAYPYVVHGGYPNPPLAALASLADQVQQHGVRLVEGSIVGDDTAFPWEPYGTGWPWDDLEWDYAAPISALTVNDNVAVLAVTPGAHAGDPVTLTWKPDVTAAYYSVQDDARTSVAGSQPSLGVDRGLGSRVIRIFGTIPAAGPAHNIDLAIQDPAEFAAIAFRKMLLTRGILVTGPAIAHHRASVDTAIYEQSVLRPLTIPSGTGATAPSFLPALELAPALPEGATVLASRTSVPLLEDMTVTVKVSQNLHAELYLRLLGSHFGTDGSIEEGARVVRAFMQRAGMLPQDFFFYDGSGMSPEDRVTPRALTALLRYVAAQPWGSEFRATLPVGGVDGTLSHRFLNGPLNGRVFAKTGTLEEVNSLSGYVTAKSGRTLVFSILCNGHMPEAKGITKTIDGIVGAVAAAN
jgi:D-alanyl-D-alanine carboxypeptidase/D-alanyl-D-alanine-endopeptidase (penicillin-binding protein 4)